MADCLLILGFFALYFTLRFLANMFYVPRGMQKWREQRRHGRANQALLQGLVKLAEGNWRQAEKEVLKDLCRVVFRSSRVEI